MDIGIRVETLDVYPQWTRPEPDELIVLLQILDLIVTGAALFLGENKQKVLRWTRGESPIPYAHWMILAEAAGLGRMWKPVRQFSDEQLLYCSALETYDFSHELELDIEDAQLTIPVAQLLPGG